MKAGAFSRRWILFTGGAALSVAAFYAWQGWAWFPSPSKEIALGQVLYAKHCASCHGKNLEGQPNWMERLPTGRMPAPPHDATGHTWHHADSDLFLITKKGVEAIVPGYESDMPPFEGVLSDHEIEAILAYIRSTWPEREREHQEARSRAKP
jgi:mono/diheme cytochrome c family protein